MLDHAWNNSEARCYSSQLHSNTSLGTIYKSLWDNNLCLSVVTCVPYGEESWPVAALKWMLLRWSSWLCDRVDRRIYGLRLKSWEWQWESSSKSIAIIALERKIVSIGNLPWIEGISARISSLCTWISPWITCTCSRPLYKIIHTICTLLFLAYFTLNNVSEIHDVACIRMLFFYSFLNLFFVYLLVCFNFIV